MRRNIGLERELDEAQSRRLCLWSANKSRQRTLARRTEAGELQCVYKGMYARPAYWAGLGGIERYRHIIRSLAAMHPQWVFCEMTAAAMYGINESTRHMKLVNIAVQRGGCPRDYGLVRHHYIKKVHSQIIDGVRVTPLGRTVFDCMRKQAFPDALAIGEAILRRRIMTKKAIRQEFQALSGRGKAAAMRALAHVTGKTENGGEAYSLGVIIDERFMEPALQKEIVYPFDLRHRDRVDCAWHTPDGRLIVAELDGRVKYRDKTMYRDGDLSATIIAEKEREERIRLVADEVVRFSFREVAERTPLVRKLIAAGVPRTGM